MTYLEVVQNNCEKHSPVSWWPRFAYHYTDITNAASILKSGYLYSRSNAKELGIMSNDNASRQVIDMTQTEAISCVRFYFRPLTPTQYYNEGYKHPQLRYDNDEHANTPVPVFFLFDLEKILSLPGVQFSEQGQSGYGAQLKSGADEFTALNFDNIYSNRLDNIQETKKYRHAEILHPNSMPVDSYLHAILCRNNLERTSLLNILKETDYVSFKKYQDKIKICKEDMFENNGLFITDCSYHDDVISIVFSDYYKKKKYTKNMMDRNGVTSLEPVSLRLVLDWMNSRGVIHHSTTEVQVDYAKSTGLTFRGIPRIKGALYLRIQVLIGSKLMCYIKQSVDGAELIK